MERTRLPRSDRRTHRSLTMRPTITIAHTADGPEVRITVPDSVALCPQPDMSTVAIPIAAADLPGVIAELTAKRDQLALTGADLPTRRPSILMTVDFIRALRQAGILPSVPYTSRVVIDAAPRR